MRRLVPVLLLLWSLSLVGTQAWAETIVLGAENDWSPYSNADGTGISNSIVREAYRSVGIEVAFQVLPYSRILRMLDTGELLGGFNVPLDADSRAKYLLGKTFLLEAVASYYQNKAKPLRAKKREELVHKERVGIVLGYGYGDHFLKAVKEGNIVTEGANSDTLNLKKLAAGRIDTTILYDRAAGLLLKQLGLEGEIEEAFVNEKIPIFVGFSNKHPKARHFCDRFEEGLLKIKDTGVYGRILEGER